MSKSRIVKSGLLSDEAVFTLWVDGPFGAKEIARIIRHLELDLEILKQSESESHTEPKQPEPLSKE